MSKQVEFFKINESTHRRTYSNNVDIKGLKAGHRRTMSNTAFDFASIKIQSPPVAKDEPLTPESIESPVKDLSQKKRRGFISLLNAAISYFNQEAQFPISFPPSEIDILKTQLEKLKASHREIDKANQKLLEDCERAKRRYEDQQKSKKILEASINDLKSYTQQLELNFKMITSEIKLEQKRNEDLQAVTSDDHYRSSPQNQGTEDSEKKLKKKPIETDKLLPRPITYKPITQRGIRNSRDILKK